MAKNRVSMKEKLNADNKAKESFFKNTEQKLRKIQQKKKQL